MSQAELVAGKSVRKTDAQTPAPKSANLECPAAPIKGKPTGKDVVPHRPSLTSKEAQQLRKSWKGLAEAVLESCDTKQKSD